ncbi:MAG: hypothetical protein Q4E17_01005 [Synergistes sp.]|nr:hypothetical protein [Synergistes sp.]
MAAACAQVCTQPEITENNLIKVRSDKIARVLLLFSDKFPCWDEETFSLAGVPSSYYTFLEDKGCLARDGNALILTEKGAETRRQIALRIGIPAFEISKRFTVEESLFSNILWHLVRRSLVDGFTETASSLNEKIPVVPACDRKDLWRRSASGSAVYKWHKSETIKAFLNRFPKRSAETKDDIRGDAAMWRWANAYGIERAMLDFTMVLRDPSVSCEMHINSSERQDIFRMKAFDRYFFKHIPLCGRDAIYDTIAMTQIFLLGQNRVYLSEYDEEGAGKEANVLVFITDTEDKVREISKKKIESVKHLNCGGKSERIEICIAAASVERLRAIRRKSCTLNSWIRENCTVLSGESVLSATAKVDERTTFNAGVEEAICADKRETEISSALSYAAHIHPGNVYANQ